MDHPASEIALACLGSGITDAGTPAGTFPNTSVGHSMQPTCLDGKVKDLTGMWQWPRPNRSVVRQVLGFLTLLCSSGPREQQLHCSAQLCVQTGLQAMGSHPFLSGTAQVNEGRQLKAPLHWRLPSRLSRLLSKGFLCVARNFVFRPAVLWHF